jgi:hypothetical protein
MQLCTMRCTIGQWLMVDNFDDVSIIATQESWARHYYLLENLCTCSTCVILTEQDRQYAITHAYPCLACCRYVVLML